LKTAIFVRLKRPKVVENLLPSASIIRFYITKSGTVHKKTHFCDLTAVYVRGWSLPSGVNIHNVRQVSAEQNGLRGDVEFETQLGVRSSTQPITANSKTKKMYANDYIPNGSANKTTSVESVAFQRSQP